MIPGSKYVWRFRQGVYSGDAVFKFELNSNCAKRFRAQRRLYLVLDIKSS